MTSATPLDEDIEMNKMGLLAEEGRDSIDSPPPMPKEGRKPEKRGPWSRVIDGFCIVLNIASTVILVFLNNWYVYLHSLSSTWYAYHDLGY